MFLSSFLNRRSFLGLLAAFFVCGAAVMTAMVAKAQNAPISDPENTIIITLKTGDVVAELYPETAPEHVERIKKLAREGFYDGIVFHRVIDGFMAQTGDPTGTGMGGSSYPDLPAEFSNLPHTRGALSMARSSDPNSANSQFFIVLKDSRFLDNQYTVFGRVIDGMEHVDQIKRGSSSRNGAVTDPDKMIRVRVAADTMP